MRKMNLKSAFRILMLFGLAGGLSFFAGCGSSGGGSSSEEFEFNSSLLVDKPWYRNVWLNRPADFGREDGLEVLQFDADGVLRQFEYGGARDTVVGRWSLSEDELVLKVGENEPQIFLIGGKSNKDYLTLKNVDVNREYFTGISELKELTADACLVKGYDQTNSYSKEYYFEFSLLGKGIEKASVLMEGRDPVELTKVDESVWSYVAPLSEKYLADSYRPHKERVKFVVEFASGFKTKLDEYIYSKDVAGLNIGKILPEHGSGSSSIVVKWEPVADKDVFYQIQLLDKDKDEDHPVFVSYVQASGANTLSIDENTGSVLDERTRLKSGDLYSVKLVAFRYEPGIDQNSKNCNYNLQAKTQFVKEMGAW
ncbi:MAG: hypothetical protein ACEPOZ_07545 [Marinifilaceae bacterium]